MRIPKSIWEEILYHLQKAKPKEGIGLLIGSHSAVSRFVPLTNVAQGVDRFEIDPREWVPLITKNNRRDHTLAAVHSHLQSPAVPSKRDLAEWHYPEIDMLIVSLQDPDLPVAKLYRIEAQRSVECPVMVSDTTD